MFQGEDFRVQGLPWEIDEGTRDSFSATPRIVLPVADQGKSGVGRLDADLMFATGFQTEPQFGNEAFAVGERIFGDDFVVRDGLKGLGSGGFCLRFGNNALSHFVTAQLQPLAPGSFRQARAAFHEGHIFPLHGVRLQLFDEVLARGRAGGDAKDPAGILIQTMNRQGFKVAVGWRQ